MEAIQLKEKRNDTVFLYTGKNVRCSVILERDLSAKLVFRAEKRKCVITLRADKTKPMQSYNEMFANADFSQEAAVTCDAVIIRWSQILQLLTALSRLSYKEPVYMKELCKVLNISTTRLSLEEIEKACTKELMAKLSMFEEYAQSA